MRPLKYHELQVASLITFSSCQAYRLARHLPCTRHFKYLNDKEDARAISQPPVNNTLGTILDALTTPPPSLASECSYERHFDMPLHTANFTHNIKALIQKCKRYYYILFIFNYIHFILITVSIKFLLLISTNILLFFKASLHLF